MNFTVKAMRLINNIWSNPRRYYCASLANYTVDLRSDCLSKPTTEMKSAMLSSCDGDDVYNENTSVLGEIFCLILSAMYFNDML